MQRLVDEARNVRDAAGTDHKDAELLAWYERAKAAIVDKVGEDSHLFRRVDGLQFWHFGGWEEASSRQLRDYIAEDVARVVAALRGAMEAHQRTDAPARPYVEVHQHQEGATATAGASATATVDVSVSVVELREAIVRATELTPEEQGAAVAALPATDDEVPTLDTIEKLLQIATKAQSLLKPVLGWVLKYADRVEFPG